MTAPKRYRLVVCVLAVVLAAAACSGDDSDDAAPSPETTDSADGAGSSAASTSASSAASASSTSAVPAESEAGCAPTTVAVEAGSNSRSLMYDGVERTYELSIPSGYDGTEPAPVLLNFHGFGGTGAEQNEQSGLVDSAGELGYIVVAPDGGPLMLAEGVEGSEEAQEQGFEGLSFWNIFGSGEISFGGDSEFGADASDVGYDDIGFVSELLDTLESELCIDAARVYSTGHSNGAGMSTALGCEIGSRLTAIAPVSGVNLTGACPGDGPVPVLAIHGDADEAAAYEGNYLLGFELGNPSVPDRMDQWAELNGCDPEPSVDEATTPGVVRTVWSGCDAETELWTVAGGPHAWPHGAADDPPTAIDAGEVVLAFFERNAPS